RFRDLESPPQHDRARVSAVHARLPRALSTDLSRIGVDGWAAAALVRTDGVRGRAVGMDGKRRRVAVRAPLGRRLAGLAGGLGRLELAAVDRPADAWTPQPGARSR